MPNRNSIILELCKGCVEMQFMAKEKQKCMHPEKKPKSGKCSPEQIAKCHPKEKIHHCK
jgi:hypothetical protein